MDQSKNVQHLRNLFLALSETSINDLDTAEENIKEEGITNNDISSIIIEFKSKLSATKILKSKSLFTNDLLSKAKDMISQSKDFILNHNNFINDARLVLMRDFKGELSDEEIASIIEDQSIIDFLENLDKDDTEKK